MAENTLILSANWKARYMRLSANELRRELSHRNLALAESMPHERTCGLVPNVVFEAGDGIHGNFLPASYRRIIASPDWRHRLQKHYSGFAALPRNVSRVRRELDCANSSDALLMNIFCYPGVTCRKQVCALLGLEPGIRPLFGFKPGCPLVNGGADRTEIDMQLGDLLVEAKLTESSFQTAEAELVRRYQDLDCVFNLRQLPSSARRYRCYQLIRGILAAHHCGMKYLVLHDERRSDLAESCYAVARAVRWSDLRSRIAILTWQELATVLPPTLQQHLFLKYGIGSAAGGCHLPEA